PNYAYGGSHATLEPAHFYVEIRDNSHDRDALMALMRERLSGCLVVDHRTEATPYRNSFSLRQGTYAPSNHNGIAWGALSTTDILRMIDEPGRAIEVHRDSSRPWLFFLRTDVDLTAEETTGLANDLGLIATAVETPRITSGNSVDEEPQDGYTYTLVSRPGNESPSRHSIYTFFGAPLPQK
ncbi:MAG TPA: hypothetical protein VJM32_01965, partial [Candidatus Saccharimonadales bacterium]|nr:hypothetical protein [Candidatus Saccharimonadales bacterium]